MRQPEVRAQSADPESDLIQFLSAQLEALPPLGQLSSDTPHTRPAVQPASEPLPPPLPAVLQSSSTIDASQSSLACDLQPSPLPSSILVAVSVGASQATPVHATCRPSPAHVAVMPVHAAQPAVPVAQPRPPRE